MFRVGIRRYAPVVRFCGCSGPCWCATSQLIIPPGYVLRPRKYRWAVLRISYWCEMATASTLIIALTYCRQNSLIFALLTMFLFCSNLTRLPTSAWSSRVMIKLSMVWASVSGLSTTYSVMRSINDSRAKHGRLSAPPCWALNTLSARLVYAYLTWRGVVVVPSRTRIW